MINLQTLKQFGRTKNISELREIAKAELQTNPTIKVYEVLEDGFVLERLANPWLGIQTSFDKLGQAMLGVAGSMEGFKDALQRTMDGMVR